MDIDKIKDALTSQIQDTIPTLKDADAILTRIGKTSNMTKAELQKLGDTAYETASKYGKAANEYLTSVEAMSRAGTENAKEMSELSLLAQTAGDISSDVADNYLIAANAAYDLKGNIKDLNAMLDGQYSIATNTAISMEDMVKATLETASVAAQCGVTMEELSSLIALVASKTSESGAEIGSSLAAVFETLQDTNNSAVTDLFHSVNISMTTMENGAKRLKTPIDLLKELSEVYSSLSTNSSLKENILTDIGGEANTSTLSALLSDWSSYEEMLNLYSKGSGSAFDGAEQSADSLEAALTRLNNTWTDTVENVAGSEELATAANTMNSFLSIINKITEKIGALGTIGLGAGLFSGFKNIGKYIRVYGFQNHLLNCFEYAPYDGDTHINARSV